MPLLVMIVGVRVAAPLMALFALLMALMILVKNRQHVSFKMSWKLIISALAGVPVGLFYLNNINENIVIVVLAVFIMVFAIVRLLDVRVKTNVSGVINYLVGFISGVLGGAYNTNGPPVIMLLSAQKWSAVKFRSTLQSYFFFTGVGVVAGHIAWGNVNELVMKYFFYGLPALIIAFLLGEFWFGKFNSKKFYNWVYVLLLVIGLSLVGKVLAA